MASFLCLSTELKLGIIEQLDLPSTLFIPTPAPELISLSRVCRVLRVLTLPYILRNITLLNEERSGCSILTLLNSPHAELVQNVHYIGVMDMAPGPEYDTPDKFYKKPSPEDLPRCVEQVLSNLVMLPNIEKLVVQFCCAKTAEKDEEAYRDRCDLQEELETYEEALESEKIEALRSLMERSYMALARNPPSTIAHLELRNVAANSCSAWWSPEFQTLLRGLSSFTISLRGGDNGAGWCINKVEAYPYFVRSLEEFFFRHLCNVKHLRFSATENGPPGLAGHISHVSLPLRAEHMKGLQALELEHVFISTDLTAFITAHSESITSVRLNNCYSGLGDSLSIDPISWRKFFSAIATENTTSLRAIEIGASSLESMQPQDINEHDHRTYKKAVQAQELRKTIPDRRLFEYRTLDDKYGMLFDNEELSFQRFQDGRDHAAWEQLREVLKRNAGDEH